ncbi:CTLH/CRA C-terminal to LisH motif domain [Sesbania bispinosa]|nr:CTLH/CRA C-terminal to LisH motif domain [Sesbania bispinosa]
MELSSIKDAFDRVAKKQKLSSSKSQEVVDQVGHEIEQALATIQSPHDPSSPVDQKSILTELKSKLNAIGALQQLEEAGEPDATALRSQFLEMHQIIQAMRERNLQPALTWDEFQKLMGCLLYAGRLESSPYSELMSPIHWEMTTEELARQFCTLLGQSYENPLSVAVCSWS